MATFNGLPGIDTTRIYFREELAEMWGREPDDDPENQRKWFKRWFLDKGLKTLPIANKVLIHGAELSEWLLRSATTRLNE